MHKRGQVTIFIIISLVLIASIGAVVYFLGSQKAAESPGVKDVSNFVGRCLEATSKSAVLEIGSQGGYTDLPNKSISSEFFSVPYYIYETQSMVPKQGIVESEIANYVERNMDTCLNNFTEIEKEGYSVKKGSNKATARLIRNEVDIKLTTKISLTKNDSTSVIQDFSAVVSPVRLITLLNISKSIADSESKNPNLICLECIQRIVEKENINVSIVGTNETNDYIYVLSDEKSNFAGYPYEYSFAAKYKFPACTTAGGCLDAVRQ